MIDEMQGLYHEDVIIMGVACAAIIGQESLEQDLGPGGFRSTIRLEISIKRDDLPNAPETGTKVKARNREWRVYTVSPNLITYEITVESPQK